MNTIIGWLAKLAPIDDMIPGNGSKTIIAAAVLFAAWVGNYLGYVSAENFDLVAKIVGGAFGVTLALKIPRQAAKSMFSLVLAACLFTGCVFQLGPDGKYLNAQGAKGFCWDVSLMEYVSWNAGFCVDGDSTASLEDTTEGDEDASP